MAIQWMGSPNKDKGREGYKPEAVVIHIMEGTLKGTDAWFRNEESGVSAFHWRGDSRMLAYDYLPASGHRGLKARDVATGEGLVVPRGETRIAARIAFEKWGPQPREVILSITDVRTNQRRFTTVTLVPP
jgi:hypothetical protein